MWVLVGLGNPGARYERTRHNTGFRVLDRLAARWGVVLEREVHRALVGDVRRAGTRVLLVKPQTYMNESGETVASVRRFYRMALEHLVVVHDDVDLPVGRVRVRAGGSAGGNRGLQSLIARLGASEFPRVKVGIGRPASGPVGTTHVLGVPGGEEAAQLAAAEERAADAAEMLVSAGIAATMNRINQKETPHGGPPL